MVQKESEIVSINSLKFPGDSGGKESGCNAGDPGLTPGSGGSPGIFLPRKSHVALVGYSP